MWSIRRPLQAKWKLKTTFINWIKTIKLNKCIKNPLEAEQRLKVTREPPLISFQTSTVPGGLPSAERSSSAARVVRREIEWRQSPYSKMATDRQNTRKNPKEELQKWIKVATKIPSSCSKGRRSIASQGKVIQNNTKKQIRNKSTSLDTMTISERRRNLYEDLARSTWRGTWLLFSCWIRLPTFPLEILVLFWNLDPFFWNIINNCMSKIWSFVK